MKADDYASRMDEIQGWKVNVVTYRIGERCYCRIDNVSPGARIACREGATLEEAERSAREDVARRLADQIHREV